MARIAILGIGNILMGDDAVGPHLINLLEAGCEFPPNVAAREVRLVGVAPEQVTTGVTLSAAVRGALPRLLEVVLPQLRELCGDARRRARPDDPDLWWERRPGS
jgi:Ni,Fe-hydrogenase maturation factor